MTTNTFIGMGPNPNPNVPDIPLGLGMQLAQNPQAFAAFGQLSDTKKTDLINNIKSAHTGDEAEEKIYKTISDLEEGAWHG